MDYFGEHIKEQFIAFWSSYRSEAILISISLVIMFVSAGFFFMQNRVTHAQKSALKVIPEKVEHTSENYIYVDISGAVKNPDVYKLKEGSRMNELIAKAGGLTKDADILELTRTVNKAKILSDQEKIYIPAIGEVKNSSPALVSTQESDESNRKINMNTASAVEIDTIVGIGPATAKKIIDNRPYKDLTDLVNKKAIGQALFTKIKAEITL